MAINDLKLFAGGSSANVMTQAEFEALAALINGFSIGLAESRQLNKVWRQASFVAAMIGLFTANNSGLDVLDDGDVDGFEAKFRQALNAIISEGVPFATAPEVLAAVLADKVISPATIAPAVQGGTWNYAVAGGSANALIVALTPALDGPYFSGLTLNVYVTANSTGAATLDAGKGARPLTQPGGLALQNGALAPGYIATVRYTDIGGGRFEVMTPLASSPLNVRAVAYTTPGTYQWTVPTGVTGVYVYVWGGGGGGGGSANITYVSAGEGGAGGGYTEGWFVVTPGQIITIVVGAGGAAGPATGTGGQGATSSFGAFCSATGGQGGRYADMTMTAARQGGMGTGGFINSQGGYGWVITPNGSSALGAAGGGSPNGGQIGCNSPTSGAQALAPGGGGGGSGGTGSVPGQAGAPGRVIIKY